MSAMEPAPEPQRQHMKQFATALCSYDYVQWPEFKRYSDALLALLSEKQAEVTKLSTRLDEISSKETAAVEELARMREINEELVGAHNSIVIQRSRLTEELARVREENQELRKRMSVALKLIQDKHAKRHFNMYAEGIEKVLSPKVSKPHGTRRKADGN